MAPDALIPVLDLPDAARAALLAAAATHDSAPDGFRVEGDADTLIAAVIPVIWNAALAEARLAVLAQVYVGQYQRGTAGEAAKTARDEAIGALRRTAKTAGRPQRPSSDA